MLEKEEIFSKVLRAGRRTYFFDVRATKADDYYITITESKKFTEEDGSFHFKKHKIYLYKEDFAAFQEILEDMTSYVHYVLIAGIVLSVLAIGGVVYLGRQTMAAYSNKVVEAKLNIIKSEKTEETSKTNSFTDIDFDDI